MPLMPSPPPASLDNCESCVYWRRQAADRTRGVCDVISYPEKYRNDIAPLTVLGFYVAQFTPRWDFWCGLYKFDGLKRGRGK